MDEKYIAFFQVKLYNFHTKWILDVNIQESFLNSTYICHTWKKMPKTSFVKMFVQVTLRNSGSKREFPFFCYLTYLA